MSSKIKRNFLIAAQPDSSWYQAVSEHEAARAGEAIHVERPLEGSILLSAPDRCSIRLS